MHKRLCNASYEVKLRSSRYALYRETGMKHVIPNWLSLLLVALLTLNSTAHDKSVPIRLHPKNPHWFQWRGKATALITSAEHYGAVINLDFDYRNYLKTLNRDGLNYTRVFAGTFVEPEGAHGIEQNTLAPRSGRFLAPWARSQTPGYVGGGNKFDLQKFNPKYLQRLNEFIALAAELDIVVELTFFSSTYTEKIWKQSALHPSNNIQAYPVDDWKKNNTTNNSPDVMRTQEALVRWLVRELNRHENLFYEIQNEPWADNHTVGDMVNPYILDKRAWPNAPEITSPSSIAWQKKIAGFIRDEESRLPSKHLIAQNVANFQLPIRESDLAGIDIINFHYAYPESVQWNYGFERPIGYDETGFAGSQDKTYRRQAWNFIMSGGALFNHLDYSFAVGAEDGSKEVASSPGGGSPKLRQQMGVLSEFIHGFDLTLLQPIQDLVLHSPGVVTRTLGTPEIQYAVYLEGRSPTKMKLKLPSGKWRCEWVSVIDGQTIDRQLLDVNEPATVIMSPEFQNEIALRLTIEH